MKNMTKEDLAASVVWVIAMLILTLSNVSCASSPKPLPSLEARTYDLVCEEPYDGFQYTYNKCSRRILGICTKTELGFIIIKAEFADKELLKQLCAMGFVFQVKK